MTTDIINFYEASRVAEFKPLPPRIAVNTSQESALATLGDNKDKYEAHETEQAEGGQIEYFLNSKKPDLSESKEKDYKERATRRKPRQGSDDGDKSDRIYEGFYTHFTRSKECEVSYCFSR
jgi:hypothetical protein